MTRSLIIKIASQSLPLNKCIDWISSELIDSLLYGRRENVSILCFVASTDNHGLVLSYPPPAPAPLPILLRWLELKPGMPVVLWTATEVPSQCQRDPSSEQVNKLSGLNGWNFTSHTYKKKKRKKTNKWPLEVWKVSSHSHSNPEASKLVCQSHLTNKPDHFIELQVLGPSSKTKILGT